MLIPENFNIDAIDLTSYQSKLDYEDMEVEEFKTLFKKLQKEKGLYGYDDNYYPITTIFPEFVIASIETGPDEGGVQLLSGKEIEKIKKLLKVV